jgi:hypothetical protein
MLDTFDQTYRYSRTESLLCPANKYENPDILAELVRMPKFEQPSRGWKLFGDRYDIDSLGIGPKALEIDAWSRVYGPGPSVRRELG